MNQQLKLQLNYNNLFRGFINFNDKIRCVECHEVKPSYEYTRDNRRANGRSSKCKECQRIIRNNKNK